MSRGVRLSLLVSGGTCCAAAVPFLLCGGVLLCLDPRDSHGFFLGHGEDVTFISHISRDYVAVGPLAVTGDWLWLAALTVSGGGMVGGLTLIIYTLRCGRRSGRPGA